MRPRLPARDWIAATFILGALATLAFLTMIPRFQAPLADQGWYTKPRYPITIEGAVERPGAYQVLKGTPVREAIAQARPSPDADLRPLKGRVEPGMRVVVPRKSERKEGG